MNESSRLKLQSILTSLETEADPIAFKLEAYHNEIFRLKKQIQSLSNKVSDDIIVFSPRADRSHNEEIKEHEKALEHLENECSSLQNRYDQINQNIEMIVDVLTFDDDDNAKSRNSLVYQEQDRQRIARDLHDSALQNMAYLVTKLDTCKQYIDTDPIKAKMELSIARQNLKDSMDSIRGIIYNLRPMTIDTDAFQSLIMKLVSSFNEHNEYKISADIEEISCKDQLVLITIYRIIEECFQNIKQHAKAYKIHLILQEQIGLYYLYVEDDGKGFDPSKLDKNSKMQFGLDIMKERVALLGGSITIDSAINSGTRIKVLLPIPK